MKDAVKLMRIYERRSAAGKPYFVGFLGQSRVLIMRDDRAELNGDTVGVWDVFVKEREDQHDRRPPPPATAYDHDGPVDTRPHYHAARPARPKARVRPTTTGASTAVHRGAREINERLAYVSLNDEIPDLA